MCVSLMGVLGEVLTDSGDRFPCCDRHVEATKVMSVLYTLILASERQRSLIARFQFIDYKIKILMHYFEILLIVCMRNIDIIIIYCSIFSGISCYIDMFFFCWFVKRRSDTDPRSGTQHF